MVECVICINSLVQEAQPPAYKRAKVPTAGSSSSSTGVEPSLQPCCTPCGHVFHRGCIMESLRARSTCPSCRDPLGAEDLRPIFLPMLSKECSIVVALKAATAKAEKAEKEKKNVEEVNAELQRQLDEEKRKSSEQIRKWDEMKERYCFFITVFKAKILQDRQKIKDLEEQVMEERREADNYAMVLVLLDKQYNILSRDGKRMTADKKAKVKIWKKAMASIQSTMTDEDDDDDGGDNGGDEVDDEVGYDETGVDEDYVEDGGDGDDDGSGSDSSHHD